MPWQDHGLWSFFFVKVCRKRVGGPDSSLKAVDEDDAWILDRN